MYWPNVLFRLWKGFKMSLKAVFIVIIIAETLAFQLSPHSLTTTGISPGELLLGRHPRSWLNLLKPHTAKWVESNQLKQKEQYDGTSWERKLNVGDIVLVKNYHPGDKWLPGMIQKKTGPLSFVEKLTDGRIRRCHQDQVCRRSM